jgi:hypothetical protein
VKVVTEDAMLIKNDSQRELTIFRRKQMDENLVGIGQLIEQQLTVLGRLDAAQFDVAVESLGVTEEAQKKLFYVIVSVYKVSNDALKSTIVEMITTIIPYAGNGAPARQLPQTTLWEIFVKLWRIVERVPFVQALDRLRYYLALIWGEDFAKDVPLNLKEAILHLGFSPAELPTISLDEFAKRIRESQPQTSMFERIYLALDLLFEARYNWPQGTARTKSPQELLLALEHALDYTPANKSSILEITEGSEGE